MAWPENMTSPPLSARVARWPNPCAIRLSSRAYSLRMGRQPGRTVLTPRPAGCDGRSRRPARYLEMWRLNRQHSQAREIFLMTRSKQLATATLLTLAILVCMSPHAHAAQCGSGPGGFEGWKQQFAGEARAKGIGANA